MHPKLRLLQSRKVLEPRLSRHMRRVMDYGDRWSVTFIQLGTGTEGLVTCE